jgi:DNA-directed RNA polymerase specialized sigma24 family protein
MSGKAWSKKEEDEVWLLYKEGQTYSEIGKKLERTEGAIKARLVGIRRRKWSQHMIEKVRELNGQRNSV